MKKSTLFTCAISLALSACTTAGLAVLNITTSLRGGYQQKTASFGAEKWAGLDIYLPTIRDISENNLVTKYDVILFLYGGRWQDGKRSDFKFVGAELARKGFVVVIPDTRKYPEVKFPEFITDSARAFAWTKKNITGYGGNKSRIHVLGHSSGAHNGALMVADNSYLAAQGLDADKDITSFIGMAGPYEFIPKEKDVKDIFGPPSKYSKMHVSTHIDGNEAPMLLMHGKDDDIVGSFNYKTLAKKIRQNKGSVKIATYEGVGHVDMVTAFSSIRYKEKVIKDLTGFFNQVADQ